MRESGQRSSISMRGKAHRTWGSAAMSLLRLKWMNMFCEATESLNNERPVDLSAACNFSRAANSLSQFTR